MKRLLTFATVFIAAVCMNAGALMAQVTNLEFTDAYFEDNTNIEETAWTKKNITFNAFTADGAYKLYAKINTDHVAGTYTEADIADYYNLAITDTETYDSYYPTAATVVVTQDGDNISLTGDMSTSNGDYHFTVTYVKPEKVDIKIGSISIYDYSKPTYSISASNSDYSVSMTITSEAADGSLVDGEYTVGEYSNIYINKYSANVYITTDSKVTVANTTAWNGDPCVEITGEVMGKNGQKYVLNLTSGIPVPDNMLQLNDEQATVTPDFRENGRWVLEGKTQNILVHMQMAKEDYAGTYDKKKWNFGYDNYVTIGGVEMSIEDAHIVVTDLGESINAVGWVLANHAGEVYYVNVDLTGVKGTEPAADGDNDVDVAQEFKELEISSDWMWGGWIIDAQNTAGYTLHLVSGTYWDGGDLPTGEYKVTNDWDEDLRITPSTYLQAGGDWGPLRAAASGTPNGSYIADADGNFWFIYKGTVNVAYDASGKLEVNLNCLNTAGNAITAAAGVNAELPTSITATFNSENIKSIKFIKNGKVVIEKAGNTYSVDGKQMVK